MPVHAVTTSEVIRMMRPALPDEVVLEPGQPGYAAATAPDNSSFVQRPAAVVQPGRAHALDPDRVFAFQRGLTR